MHVQFIAPTVTRKRDGSVIEPPANKVADVVLIPGESGMDNIGLGGAAIWVGDGSIKTRPKGELSLSWPQFGAFGPVKVATELCDRNGKVVRVDHTPSAAGTRQFDALKANILATFKLATDPYARQFELSERERIALAAAKDEKAGREPVKSETPDEMRAELERLRALLAAKSDAKPTDAHLGAVERIDGIESADLGISDDAALELATRPDADRETV